MSRSIAPKLVEKIKLEFDDVILDISRFQEQTTVCLKAEHTRQVCEFLKNEKDLDFNLLLDLAGAHYPDRERDFEVIYNYYSLTHKHFLRLKAQIKGDPPRVATISDLWKAADWLEREAYDMYGIIFEGHPNLKRLFLDDSWIGFPLRKDYPLEGRD